MRTLSLLALCACASPPQPAPTPYDGTSHTYATTALRLGHTQAEQAQIAFNLDDDGQGKLDDGIGYLLLFVEQAGMPLITPFEQGGTSVAFTLWSHDPTTDAAAVFRADGGQPMAGTITDGVFTAAGGTVPLHILVGDQPPVDVTLVGAKVELDLRSCTGRIGGGVLNTRFLAAFVPWVASLMDQRIGLACDAEGTCTPNPACRTDETACDDPARTLRSLFDKAETDCTSGCVTDGQITPSEVRYAPIAQIFEGADVHLLDADGAYDPEPWFDPGVTLDSNSFAFAFDFDCGAP